MLHDAIITLQKILLMNALPFYISGLFIATTFFTLWFLYKATNHSKKVLMFSSGWLFIQAFLAKQEFYLQTKAMPPRLLAALLPTILLILILFTKQNGKAFIVGLNTKYLILLNIVRIPVEMVLLLLFIHKAIPQSMTFEGSNFDILSGITALVIYYFFSKNKLSKRIFRDWNILCLILVVNVVITGILSAPLPFQQFAFKQPNIAVLYFPYIWLPSFIVPVVIFSHLALLRKSHNIN